MEWYVFLFKADEWLLEYASPPYILIAQIKLFCVGQAFELYLKGAYTKFTNDSQSAINYGHGIKELLNKCKQIKPDFLDHIVLEKIFI